MIAISASPLILVIAGGLITGKEIEVGPFGILFLAGLSTGVCFSVLGAIAVLVQRRKQSHPDEA